MKNKIIFIINPISGKGKGKSLKLIIDDFFKDREEEVIIRFTEYEGHSIQIIQEEVRNNPTKIIACGGDGTINEVAQALVGKSIPLGVIPIGSGNGLASNLKIPKDEIKALEIVISDKISQIDVGLMNGKYFFSNMGLGIDSTVIHRYTEQNKRNLIGYLKATIWSFFNYKSLHFDVSIDGFEIKDKSYFFVLCSNSNEAGYGISFNPNAKLNDQKLDLLCVEKLNFFQLLIFGFSVLTNQIHKMKKANVFQGEEIIFTSKSDQIIAQIDGEAIIINENQAKVSILPNALYVIIPSN